MDDSYIHDGAKLVEEIFRSAQISSCIKLVNEWIDKGANLPLAGIFTQHCAATVRYLQSGITRGAPQAMNMSSSLFRNSCRPLAISITTTVEDYCTGFCHDNARWETLGLFFAAVSQATIDLTNFEPLYSSQQQRRQFRRLSMRYSDRCLETSLSLDCLNDLQLVLQYENFIIHSNTDGDQSKFSTLPSLKPI